MQDNILKETPKLQTAKSLLEDAFSEYKGHIEERDAAAIAKKTNLGLRTVNMYLSGDIRVVETGQLVFRTLRQIVLDRIKETKKLVA